MSFGYSVGDILAITKLAWKVYNVYKNAPDDFSNISDEIKSLHIILDSDDLQAIALGPMLTSEKRGSLREILRGCTNVLEDLDRLLDKYKSLGSHQSSSYRTMDRVKWGQEDRAELRSRLISNITLLNTFVANCVQGQIQSSQAEMQREIGEIHKILRNTRHRNNSSASLHSIASVADSVNSKEAWKQFYRDLRKVGVTAEMLRERKDQIVNLFQSSSPPMVLEEILEVQRMESPTSPGSSDADLSKDAKTGKNKRNLSFKKNWAPLNALIGPLLVAAAKTGDVNAVKLRLSVVGDVEYKDINNYTALGWAAANGHIEVVQLLLEKGANIEAPIGNTGITALYIAAQNRCEHIVKLLLEKGANMEGAYTDVKWCLVTGERVVRVEEIVKECGSITVGACLEDFDYGKILEFETLDSLDSLGKLRSNVPQRVMQELERNLLSTKAWNGRIATSIANALASTMELTMNTLLPPNVMNPISVQCWPDNAVGRVWHWPLMVQMEVDSDGWMEPEMEEQRVRISLIQKATGRWLVIKEGVEALLTLWLFTLKQRRLKYSKHKGPDHANVQPAFVRLIGSNTELTRRDIMRWYTDHCSRVYEGTPITITESMIDKRRADEIDIEMDRGLGQVMGMEQVDLRSEYELANEHGGVQHRLTPEDQATVHWHYFRGRELPQILYDDWPESGEGQYTSLATTIECTLEELCAQEILFRFFFAIGTFMREERGIRVLGNTTLSYRNTNFAHDANDAHPERRLKTAKFHNSILQRIALEAYQSKVCSSLEAAYQCMIPAFSQARVLPEVGEAVSSHVTQIFRAMVKKGDWIKACDLYDWVWDSMGCKFPHHSNEDMYAISLFINFIWKLRHEANTNFQWGILTKQLAARGEEMLKMITEQEFQVRDVVRALGFMLHSLDELDGQMQAEVVESELTEADSSQPTIRRNSQEESNGYDAPEPSEEGSPGMRSGSSAEGEVHQPSLEADKLELRRLKEEVEKLLPLLGFTPSHRTTAHVLGAGSPENADLEQDANILDILQRRPLHYAAANPSIEVSMVGF